MALQYAILLALAFAGVVVAESNYNHETNNVLPWRMSTEEIRNNSKCKTSDVKKYRAEWRKAYWCFEVVRKDVPINPQECDAIKTTIIDAFQCFLKELTSEMQYKLVKSLDRLFNMIHLWATELKEEVKDPKEFQKKITKCYDDKTQAKLRACTNSTLGEEDEWGPDYMVNIMAINEAYYRGNGRTFKQCIMGVLDHADCDTIADDVKSLFEKAAASIPVTSFILIIGASLFSLYL